MKRRRSYKEQQPESSRSRPQTETPATDFGNMESCPQALGQMIATIIKEISKETGGLANLSRSLVNNSINNGPPHVNINIQENECSRMHQSPLAINMQAGQPQQSSNQLEPSQDSQQQTDPHISTPDLPIIQKQSQVRGTTRCHKLLMTVGKIKIVTNELGQPVGQEASKLTSFLGLTARDGELAPLTYTSWNKMPEENKEKMWQKVLTKFDIDPSCRSWVLMSLKSKWKNFKSLLKVAHYDTHETDEERLADRDHRVFPDQWSFLVSQWSSEKWQSISARAKASRAKVRFNHTSGTKSFARLLEEERAKRPDGQEPTQAELFILTRTHKNGQPVNEATAAVISQLRESESQGLDAISSLPGTVMPNRSEALRMVKEKNAEVVEMKERLKSVEETCSQMAAQMSVMVEMMANMQKNSNNGTGNLLEPASTSNRRVPAKRLVEGRRQGIKSTMIKSGYDSN